jgi:hypothetical protein
MNHIIPPGARSNSKKGAAAGGSAWIEAARYNEPETLNERIER